MKRHVVAYDSSCGLCRASKRALAFLDPSHRFTFVSLLEADSGGMLDAVPAYLRYSSFHVIAANGEIYSGADGLMKVIQLLPAGRLTSRMITLAPLGRQSVRLIYSALSSLHDRGNCSLERSAGTL